MAKEKKEYIAPTIKKITKEEAIKKGFDINKATKCKSK